MIFYLAPFHPAFYNLFCDDEDYAGMILAEDYLLEYAENRDISVYGSYNPDALGLSEESFLDGVHLRDYEQENALVLRK